MKIHADPPPCYYEPPEYEDVLCPVCGEATDTFVEDKDGNIVGCTECVKFVDAYEVTDE